MLASCGGTSVAYDETGSGPAVVFVHGFPHNRTLWAPQTNALAQHARCLVPDLPGFGESPLHAPLGMDQYADDMVCVLDAARVERAVVVGLSMGGYVAFALWRRHPGLVRALVLASTRAAPDTDEARARRTALIATARAMGSEAVADTQIGSAVSPRTRDGHPELVRTVHAMQASASVEGIVAALEAMIARPDSTPDLAGITVPTLVIAGREDALIPVEEAETLAAAIPHGQLELLAGAGHLCNIERPAAFNHLLGEFLASLAAT